jgi:hypothetical protein
MTVILTRYTDNIIPWGWNNMGHGFSSVQVRLARSGIRKVTRVHSAAANADYPPLGMDEAVTGDRGLALLSEIIGR